MAAKKKATKKKALPKMVMIDKKRWSLAVALWWGLTVFALGALSTLFGYGSAMVSLLGSVYLGYNATFFGTLIGTVWALVDMFIGVWILLWIYEKVVQYAP